MKSHKTVYKSRADETHFVCRRPSELSVIESTRHLAQSSRDYWHT